MGKMIANENNRDCMRKCVFCTHWYDPANSAIKLVRQKIWEYDSQARNICREKNVKVGASSGVCSKFVCKV